MLRSITALTLAAAVSIGVTACAQAAATPGVDDAVLVLTPTSGASALVSSDLEPVLALLDEAGDRVVAVVADGEPRVVLDVTIPELPGNSKDRSDWLGQFRSDAQTAILAKTATVAEVDVTEGIALGAESFRAGTRHTLFVFASGLQTTGALSMLDGRLYAEPADLVTHVEQEGGIPDLATAAVRMPKLGVVTDPQPQLDEGARSALADVWAEFFRRAGSTDVQLAPTSLVGKASDAADLPFVSPVAIERPEPIVAGGCRQVIGADSIGFAAGSAEIVDVAGARALVERVHDALVECPGDYLVEGSSSSEGTRESNAALAKARAQAVADLFASVTGEHLAADQIVGWGEDWPCRRTDVDAAGDLILDAAIANRSVVVSKGGPGC